MPGFHLHWVTVLGATVAYFVVGALWYTILFPKPWLRGIGMSKDQVASDDASWVYAVQLACTAVLVVCVSWVLHDWLNVRDWDTGLVGGLVLGVIAVFASSGDFLYERNRRNWTLFLVNSGYRVAGLAVTGLIVGLLA